MQLLTQRKAKIKPFKIKFDASRSLRSIVRDVIAQAVEREKNAPGMYYAGTVLQHLVGAKLDCVLGKGHFEPISSSNASLRYTRNGDFFLGNAAIHVTTSTSEALIKRCRENLEEGLHPIVVTLQRGQLATQELANYVGLADRIDVFEIEQFVALNLYELAKFRAQGCKTAVTDLISRYNEIVEQVETDPSLKIELRQ